MAKNNKEPFDKEAFKKGIAYSESRSYSNPYEAVPKMKDGTLLSSAAGKYQFLYNNIKNLPELKGVTKEQFLKNPELQEKIMDDTINKHYYRNAKDLTEEFSERLGDKWNYRPDEVAMLTHFLGRQGARDYFKKLEKGEEYQVAGAVNATVDEYLSTYNKGIGTEKGLPPEFKKKVESKFSIPKPNISFTQTQDSLNPQRFRPQGMIIPPSGNNNLIMPQQQFEGINNFQGSLPSFVDNDVEENGQPIQQQVMPQSQQQKPQSQTTAGFINEYLASNKFEKGGFLKDPPVTSNSKKKENPEFIEYYIKNDKLKDDYLSKIQGFNAFAIGGQTNTQNMNPNNILTEFNGGSSHDQMSNGGIQVGMGENGMPNTVEQNETMSKGYVFSDRLKLDEDILAKYYLPKKLKNKSPAEASKIISQAHKENNNIVDKESTQEFIDRLIGASEELRQLEEIKNRPPSMLQPEQGIMGAQEQGMNPAMMEQMAMEQQGQNQMFFGGENEEMSKEGFSDMVGGAMELGQMAFGKTGIDTSGATSYGVGRTNGGAALSGAMTGAKAGMALGPVGAIGGAIIGAGAGVFGNSRQQKDMAEAAINSDMAHNSQFNTRANGGFINQLENGGSKGSNPWRFDFNSVMPSIPNVTNNSVDFHNATKGPYNAIQKPSMADSTFGKVNAPNIQNTSNYKKIQGLASEGNLQLGNSKENGNNFFEGFGNKLGEVARYAPIAANAYQLATLKKPEVTSLDRLDQRYNPSFVDEKSMINRSMSDFNSAVGDLKNASNNSVGALRNNLLGAHLNRTKALSDSFLQAEGMNAQQRGISQQFNHGVDSTNLQQSNAEKEINMRNQAAYDNNKSKFISALGNDIGNIGLEELRKQYPELASMDYDSRGRYLAFLEAEKKRKQNI